MQSKGIPESQSSRYQAMELLSEKDVNGEQSGVL